MASEEKATKSLDIETPQSVARRRQSKVYQESKKTTITEEWYEIRGKKFVRVQRTPTGKFTTFICAKNAQNKDYIEGLKKKGLVRASAVY